MNLEYGGGGIMPSSSKLCILIVQISDPVPDPVGEKKNVFSHKDQGFQEKYNTGLTVVCSSGKS